MSKAKNSKKIFRLIQTIEKILPDTGLAPKSLNQAIRKASTATSLVAALWEAFHSEDKLEGFSQMTKDSPSLMSSSKDMAPNGPM